MSYSLSFDESEAEAVEQVRREQLLEDALALGRRIYAEPPKAFAKRMRRYVAA